MELGQMNMIQMPLEAAVIVAETASPQVSAGETGNSVFAGVLRDMTPQQPGLKEVVPEAFSAGMQMPIAVQKEVAPALLIAAEVQLNEKPMTLAEKTLPSYSSASPVTGEPHENEAEPSRAEDLTPQNVVMSSAGAMALVSQDVGRKPESEQLVAKAAKPMVSEVQAEQLKAAYNVAAPTEARTPSPVPATKVAVTDQPAEITASTPPKQKNMQTAQPLQTAAPVVPGEQVAAQASQSIVSEVQTQQPREAYSETAAPEATKPSQVSAAKLEVTAQPVEITAAATPRQTNMQEKTAVPVAHREQAAAQAQKPIVSEVQAQKLMEAYSVTTAPETKVPSPISVNEATSHAEVVAVPAKPQPQEFARMELPQPVPTASSVTPLELPEAQAKPHVQETAAAVEKTTVTQIPVMSNESLTSLTSSVGQKTIQNVSDEPLAEKAGIQPIKAEAKEVVANFNDFQVVSQKPETPAIKATPVGTAVISMQQFMDAYSQPVKAATNANSSIAATQEQRPVDAVLPQTLSPGTERTPLPVTQQSAENLSDQHLDGKSVLQRNAVAAKSAVPVNQEQTLHKTVQVHAQATPAAEQTQAVAVETSTSRIVEMGAIHARPAVKRNDTSGALQEEEPLKQKPAAPETKTALTSENVLAEAVKNVAGASTGENDLTRDSGLNSRSMGAHVYPIAHQQAKSEAVTATPVVVTAGTADVPEQVAKQLGDHFTKNEIKAGSEQIVLRLSPENLGELRVNLRIENQRLSVEIVTDNRIVRDSLIQNSDTLKETLAKQNIKMDSFDVSTGSNNGSAGRDQNDWRELAKQQQHNAWNTNRGYRLPLMEQLPIPVLHLAKSAHSMLDILY